MAQSDEEWDKVREMVRNAPPGTAQKQWNPHELIDAAPPRAISAKALVALLLLALAAGAGYYAYEERDRLFGGAPKPVDDGKRSATDAATTDTAASAARDAPVPPSAKGSAETKSVSVRKGLKNVNVRTNPSPNSPTVARLTAGGRAEKLSESGDWVELRFQSGGKTMEGWVRRDLLDE